MRVFVSAQSNWEVAESSYDLSCQSTVMFFVLMLCYLFRMIDDVKIKNLARTQY